MATMTTASWSDALYSISSRTRSESLLATLAVLVSSILLLCVTRLFTGIQTGSSKSRPSDAPQPIVMLPYWVPLLGHLPQFFFGTDEFLRKSRDSSSHGVFSLKFPFAIVNVFTRSSLITSAITQRPSNTNSNQVVWTILSRLFGAPSHIKDRYIVGFHHFYAIDNATILRGPHLAATVTSAIGRIARNLPDLVSFNPSPVDQAPWERSSTANPNLLDGGDVVEVDLFAIMREFLGHQATTSIMGQAFMDNNPDVLQDIWALDNGIPWLLTGLPRWFPILSLTRAHIARRRLLRAITEWHRVLDTTIKGEGDAGIEWTDVDVGMSEWITQRAAKWRELGFKPSERASADLAIIWAVNTNANTLSVWLLLRILSTPGLLSRILHEITPYTTITVPSPINNHSSPPVTKIDAEALTKHCPLFKASYLEALRIHSAPWSVRQVERNFTVSDVTSRKTSPKWQVQSGSYILIPHDVHQTDPQVYPSPSTFDPNRFLKPDLNGNNSVDIGTLRPYGGGPSMCKGRFFAEREILGFVAGVLRLWDIEAVGDAGWVLPQEKKMTAVTMCRKDIRVKIRRRDLSNENSRPSTPSN